MQETSLKREILNSDSFREGFEMPLYEGIGLISEKHAVVLDIGTSLTKCGYAGEMSPRLVKTN